MTMAAFRYIIPGELTAMDIQMAIETPETDWLKPDVFLVCTGLHHNVTFTAADITMLPLQFKATEIVVKCYRMP